MYHTGTFSANQKGLDQQAKSTEEASMQLTQKVALVTGAGSGIGRSAALLLAKEGAQPLEGGKPGTAEQIARLVLFLASDASTISRARRSLSMAPNRC
jgi:hypothetical protein